MKLLTAISYLRSMLNPGRTASPWRDFSRESAVGYLHLLKGDSSKFLWEKVENNFPNSILEIGCNSGSRIFSVAGQHPNSHFVGIDISREAIAVAGEYAKSRSFSNTSFFCVDISNKKELSNFFCNRTFNLIFSWACLIYIHPLRIENIIKKMISHSDHIALIEQHNPSLNFFYRGIPVSGGNNWIRNYEKLFCKLAPNKKLIEISHVPTAIWQPGGGGGHLVQIK